MSNRAAKYMMAQYAALSQDAINKSSALSQQELDFARQQYNDYKPTYDKIAAAQLDSMNQANTQGKAYFDNWQNNYQPIEQKLAKDAMDYNTDAHREQLAGQAAADAGQAFSNQQAQGDRAMASMGVNPNSGRFAGLQQQGGLALAAAQAGAMNNARTQAEQQGWQRSTNAAALGRGMPGASQGAYSLGLAAGNSAGNSLLAPVDQMNQGFQLAGNTQAQGYSSGLAGFGNATQMYANRDRPKPGFDIGGALGGLGSVGQGLGALKTAGMFGL